MMPKGFTLVGAGPSNGRETINEGVLFSPPPFFIVATFWLIKVLFMVPGRKCLLYDTLECQFSLLNPGCSNAI
jgi:hypothetical protein